MTWLKDDAVNAGGSLGGGSSITFTIRENVDDHIISIFCVMNTTPGR